MIKDIIIAGGGGQAKVLAGVLLQLNNYRIIGCLDDNEDTESLLGIQRIGKLTEISSLLKTKTLALGIGHFGDSTFYKKIIKLYEDAGFHFETIIAPSAVVSPFAKLGVGVAIAEGSIIQPSVKIKDYVIINTKASIDHDCTIGNYTHIAPGVAMSGGVTVGDNCLLGTGSRIIQGIKITNDCIIGAGAVVTKDCKEAGTYVGVPAKKIK